MRRSANILARLSRVREQIAAVPRRTWILGGGLFGATTAAAYVIKDEYQKYHASHPVVETPNSVVTKDGEDAEQEEADKKAEVTVWQHTVNLADRIYNRIAGEVSFSEGFREEEKAILSFGLALTFSAMIQPAAIASQNILAAMNSESLNPDSGILRYKDVIARIYEKEGLSGFFKNATRNFKRRTAASMSTSVGAMYAKGRIAAPLFVFAAVATAFETLTSLRKGEIPEKHRSVRSDLKGPYYRTNVPLAERAVLGRNSLVTSAILLTGGLSDMFVEEFGEMIEENLGVEPSKTKFIVDTTLKIIIGGMSVWPDRKANLYAAGKSVADVVSSTKLEMNIQQLRRAFNGFGARSAYVLCVALPISLAINYVNEAARRAAEESKDGEEVRVTEVFISDVVDRIPFLSEPQRESLKTFYKREIGEIDFDPYSIDEFDFWVAAKREPEIYDVKAVTEDGSEYEPDPSDIDWWVAQRTSPIFGSGGCRAADVEFELDDETNIGGGTVRPVYKKRAADTPVLEGDDFEARLEAILKENTCFGAREAKKQELADLKAAALEESLRNALETNTCFRARLAKSSEERGAERAR